MKEKYILIAYYDVDIRHLITKTLNYYGYKSISTNTGAEVLNIIRDNFNEIGLILLDITLPDMTDFSILQMIKSNERYRDIPIVIMTVRAIEEEIKREMDLGANSILNLPYELEDFIKCVKKNIHFDYDKCIGDKNPWGKCSRA